MKRQRLNNKGYMLVEIILASVIAMGVAYFITDLTIKLKNKNDDLLVKTLVATDQAIMYNEIMKDLNDNPESFSCDNIVIEDNVFKYKDFTNVVSDYATLELNGCSYDATTGVANISIGLDVRQLPNDNFDVVINNGDTTNEEDNTPGDTPSEEEPKPTYTCTKSASKNYSKVKCSSTNYDNPSSACPNKYYSNVECQQTPTAFTAGYAECWYDEFSGKYTWRTNNLLPKKTGLLSCTAQVTDGVTACTYEQFSAGTTKISSCTPTAYSYSGTITCYSYYCSEGERSGKICYLYNQYSCDTEDGWTAS